MVDSLAETWFPVLMTTNLTHETHLMGTAHDIAVVLGAEDPSQYARVITPNIDRIVLSNAQARRLLALATQDPLVAAYDAVFDFKDTKPAGGHEDYAAYEILGAIERAMELLGTPKPRRFDNKAGA